MLRSSLRRVVTSRPVRGMLHTTRPPVPPEYRSETRYADAVRRKAGQGLLVAVGTGTMASFVAGPLLLLPTMAMGWGGGCYSLWRLAPFLQQDPSTLTSDQNETIESTYGVLAVSSGLLLTPALMLMPNWTVPAAVGISAGALVGLSQWSWYRSSLLAHWQDVVIASAGALTTANLLALSSFWWVGDNPVARVLSSGYVDALVMLVAAVTAHATNVAVRVFHDEPHTPATLVVVNLLWDFLAGFKQVLDAIKSYSQSTKQ